MLFDQVPAGGGVDQRRERHLVEHLVRHEPESLACRQGTRRGRDEVFVERPCGSVQLLPGADAEGGQEPFDSRRELTAGAVDRLEGDLAAPDGPAEEAVTDPRVLDEGGVRWKARETA